MFCTGCGQELPHDARFCLRCGKPQAEDAGGADDDEARWETARVVWLKSGLLSQQFTAEVTAPHGTYTISDPQGWTFHAEEKRGGPQRSDRTAVTAHRSLVERLMREGFEPVGVGDRWWMERFRRPVGDRAYEHCELVSLQGRFAAEVVGRSGVQTVGMTDRRNRLFKRPDTTNAEAVDALIAELEADGWEQVDPWGSKWWQRRFRRRLASPTASARKKV
jgi:hypothetical protein